MKKLILVLVLVFSVSLSAASITTTVCPGAGCVDYDSSAQASLAVQITGTFSGTITFQASVDGTTFVSLAVQSLAATDTTKVTTATAPGAWRVDVRGIKTVRIVFTSHSSGTAIVTPRFLSR